MPYHLFSSSDINANGQQNRGFAFAYRPGDESVGISDRVVVITDLDGFVSDARCLDLADVAAAEKKFREKLADAFEVVGDGRPKVICHYD